MNSQATLELAQSHVQDFTQRVQEIRNSLN